MNRPWAEINLRLYLGRYDYGTLKYVRVGDNDFRFVDAVIGDHGVLLVEYERAASAGFVHFDLSCTPPSVKVPPHQESMSLGLRPKPEDEALIRTLFARALNE